MWPTPLEGMVSFAYEWAWAKFCTDLPENGVKLVSVMLKVSEPLSYVTSSINEEQLLIWHF